MRLSQSERDNPLQKWTPFRGELYGSTTPIFFYNIIHHKSARSWVKCHAVIDSVMVIVTSISNVTSASKKKKKVFFYFFTTATKKKKNSQQRAATMTTASSFPSTNNCCWLGPSMSLMRTILHTTLSLSREREKISKNIRRYIINCLGKLLWKLGRKGCLSWWWSHRIQCKRGSTASRLVGLRLDWGEKRDQKDGCVGPRERFLRFLLKSVFVVDQFNWALWAVFCPTYGD